MSSGILVQLLMIATTLVFTRLFSVENFGELAFYASYGSILAVISGLRFDYLNLKDSIHDKYVGYLVSSMCCIILNIIIFFLLFVASYFYDVLSKYSLYSMFLFGISYGLFHSLSQYFIANKDYKKFIFCRLVQVSSIFIIGLSLYLAQYNNNPLILSYSFVQLLLGFIGLLIIIRNNVVETTIQQTRVFFNENLSEALKNTIISFAQYSAPLVPVLIGGMLFDEKNIGAYFVFAQMISAPLSVIRRNLLVYLNGEFSSIQKFRSLFKYINKKYIALGCIFILFAFAVVYFLDEEITLLVLGGQWVVFSYMLFPLLLYFIIDTVLQPITTLLPLWGNANYSISLEVLKIILLTTMLPLLTIYFSLSFMGFLLLFIAIMIIAYVMITLKTLNTAFDVSNKEFDYEIK